MARADDCDHKIETQFHAVKAPNRSATGPNAEFTRPRHIRTANSETSSTTIAWHSAILGVMNEFSRYGARYSGRIKKSSANSAAPKSERTRRQALPSGAVLMRRPDA